MRLKFAYFIVTLVMCCSLSVAFEHKAYAYVDPGSGLFMLQAAGTVITGILFTLRRRIKSLFIRNQSSELPTETMRPDSEA